MAEARVRGAAGVPQAAEGVGADGFEQMVAAIFEDHKGLFDERLHDWSDGGGVAHGFGGVEFEAAGEDGQWQQDGPFVFAKEVETPIEGVTERTMPDGAPARVRRAFRSTAWAGPAASASSGTLTACEAASSMARGRASSD